MKPSRAEHRYLNVAQDMLEGSVPATQYRAARKRGRQEDVLSCDYNGWNDAPEDEREWFDQHPEIWTGTPQEASIRPFRATRLSRATHWRGMAA